MDLRKMILKRLAEEEVSRYRLARRLRDQVPQRTIYAYLAGKCDTTTEVLQAILSVLDIEVTPMGTHQIYQKWQSWEQRRGDRKAFRRRSRSRQRINPSQR